MKTRYWLVFLLLGIFLISGCVSSNTENKTNITACSTLAKACPDGSYVTENASNNCQFDACPTVNPPINISEAMQIANNSICTQMGTLKETEQYNPITKTWWITLEPYESYPLCSPACIIDVISKTADVNWRCRGFNPTS